MPEVVLEEESLGQGEGAWRIFFSASHTSELWSQCMIPFVFQGKLWFSQTLVALSYFPQSVVSCLGGFSEIAVVHLWLSETFQRFSAWI